MFVFKHLNILTVFICRMLLSLTQLTQTDKLKYPQLIDVGIEFRSSSLGDFSDFHWPVDDTTSPWGFWCHLWQQLSHKKLGNGEQAKSPPPPPPCYSVSPSPAPLLPAGLQTVQNGRRRQIKWRLKNGRFLLSRLCSIWNEAKQHETPADKKFHFKLSHSMFQHTRALLCVAAGMYCMYCMFGIQDKEWKASSQSAVELLRKGSVLHLWGKALFQEKERLNFPVWQGLCVWTV